MLNQVSIIGNLGRDPEMRYTPSGQAVTSLNVAVDDSYVKDGQKVKRTMWVKVSVWGKQAESCNTYLAKGKKVFVQGRLTFDEATGSPRLWNTKDGKPGASFEVNADTVRFLSSASEGSGNAEGAPAEEEIPF